MRTLYRVPKSALTPYKRLVREVAEAERVTSKVARAVLEQFIALLPEAVWATGRLVVPGLGAFRVRSRKARRIANPQTGAAMQLPRLRVVAVRVSSNWRTRG